MDGLLAAVHESCCTACFGRHPDCVPDGGRGLPQVHLDGLRAPPLLGLSRAFLELVRQLGALRAPRKRCKYDGADREEGEDCAGQRSEVFSATFS
jgi:hypothetical protein